MEFFGRYLRFKSQFTHTHIHTLIAVVFFKYLGSPLTIQLLLPSNLKVYSPFSLRILCQKLKKCCNLVPVKIYNLFLVSLEKQIKLLDFF